MNQSPPPSKFQPQNPTGYFTAPPRLAAGHTPETFFGHPYTQNEDTHAKLISVLSAGHIQAKFPYHFSLAPLGCHMALYTESGCGKLYAGDKPHALEAHTLLLSPCTEPFRVEITVSPWNYFVFFLDGAPLDFYSGCLPAGRFPLFSLPEYSPVIRDIYKLAENDTGGTIRNKLADHRLLTDLFTELLLEHMEGNAQGKKMPSYLSEMKALFDLDYRQDYTLDMLEERFAVSKYRLCREFHSFFGQSPLQYLNGKRVDAAKELLLSSDYRVHEIGSQVGVENTNHFIYLFKKYTGMTPLAFRRNR